jgi:hypothetical protein
MRKKQKNEKTFRKKLCREEKKNPIEVLKNTLFFLQHYIQYRKIML